MDLNDNLMRRIRRKAMEEQKSLKQVINDALGEAIGNGSAVRPKRRAYRCPTFSMGEPSANLDKAIDLADAEEDEAVLQKLDLRK